MEAAIKPPIHINDISNDTLKEITALLRFDSSKYTTNRETNKWLHKQGKKVYELQNEALLRPSSLLYRGCVKVFCYPTLCRAHKELDQKVMGGLLWNVAYECTAQTNIYRVLRNKGRFGLEVERPPELTEEQLKQVERHEESLNEKLHLWMDRINDITALWLGEGWYRDLCCSKKRDFLPLCALTRCDACMLAAVGGNHVYLMVLRASLLARYCHERWTPDDHDQVQVDDPPLLRVIDAWISSLECEDTKVLAVEFSEDLAPILMGMREYARKMERRSAQRWNETRVKWTKDRLPIPMQHRPRTRPADSDIPVFRMKPTRRFMEKMASESASSSSSSSSAKMSGAIRTDKDEAPSLEENCPAETPRTESIVRHEESPPERPNSSPGDTPPPSTVDPQETTSSSSWTSGVVDDEHIDDDNNDSPPAGMKLLSYNDTDAGDKETEHSKPDADVVSPEASSVYSCDERERQLSVHVPLQVSRDACSSDGQDKEGGCDNSMALEKWEGSEGSDGAASCYKSMGWGAPKKQ
ncbi:hypothetical protein ACQKWADRAFT_136347 [Trichoderma austrokoningii]